MSQIYWTSRGRCPTACTSSSSARPTLRSRHAWRPLIATDARWHGYLPNDEALARVDGVLAGVSLLRDEPNYRHSLPTEVVEYMAPDVLVVTTPAPRAAEIVAGHACGVVVLFGDGVSAARVVESLHANPAKRQAIGDRGHTVALRHYDWNAPVPRFAEHLVRWAATHRN